MLCQALPHSVCLLGVSSVELGSREAGKREVETEGRDTSKNVSLFYTLYCGSAVEQLDRTACQELVGGLMRTEE